MKPILFIISFLTISFGYGQCQDYREFYYPFSNKIETKIYKYQNSYTGETFYWEVTTNPTNQTILTEFYNSELVKQNIFKEKLDEKGSKLIQYTNLNSSDKDIPSEIINDEVFKWCGDDEFKYEIQFISSDKNESFSKTRKFDGIIEYEFENKIYNALRVINILKEKNSETKKDIEFYQLAIYIPEKGIVELSTYLPNGVIQIYQLKKIIKTEEFEILKAASR